MKLTLILEREPSGKWCARVEEIAGCRVVVLDEIEAIDCAFELARQAVLNALKHGEIECAS